MARVLLLRRPEDVLNNSKQQYTSAFVVECICVCEWMSGKYLYRSQKQRHLWLERRKMPSFNGTLQEKERERKNKNENLNHFSSRYIVKERKYYGFIRIVVQNNKSNGMEIRAKECECIYMRALCSYIFENFCYCDGWKTIYEID